MWKNILTSKSYKILTIQSNNLSNFSSIHQANRNQVSRRGVRSPSQNNATTTTTQRSLKKLDQNSTTNMIKIGNVNSGAKFKSFKFSSNRKKEDDYEKRFMLKGKSDMIPDNLENQDPEQLLKTEEDLDLYSVNENFYHRKEIDQDIKKRTKTKLGIIKKKISQLEGRQEPYLNLLTWDAKEQIKHLNLNEPEIWTAEKLSESFPITLESCKKLLRSTWAPKTLDELATHDEKVIENWKYVAEAENSEPAGPAINIYKEYKRMNKLSLLKHATGLPGVDFERSSHIFSDSFAVHQSLLCEPGKFSNIIKFQDNKVKEMFNRNEVKVDKSAHKTIEHEESESNKFKEHLTMTKAQLSKSLSKILSTKTSRKNE